MTHAKRAGAATCLESAECTSGLRNRYYRGKQMKAEEFETEQAYFIERRRLVNRGVLGWGVVYGFGLVGSRPPHQHNPDEGAAPRGDVAATDKITVGRGFALDEHGREIVLTRPAPLGIDNVFALVRDASGCKLQKIDRLAEGKYLLSVHYAERYMGDANLPQGCECARPEKRFACETVLFSLEALSGDCHCAEKPCTRGCHCGTDACASADRGPHACLCQWVTRAEVVAEPGRLCEWQGFAVDPKDGVGLACVSVVRSDDPCAPVAFASIDDDCSPRRLVKSNDLLYDLLRGCDLTKIAKISWFKWHRNPLPMPWPCFIELMNAADEPWGVKDVVTGLSITFSGPVLVDTLTIDCFAVRFSVTGEDTGWTALRTVPVVRVLTAHFSGDPPGTTRSGTLCVAPDWISEIRSRPSVFKHEGATVELEVYGDYILDCHGQPVDANARGFALRKGDRGVHDMSGNGAPGGTFRSVFRVERHQPYPSRPPSPPPPAIDKTEGAA